MSAHCPKFCVPHPQFLTLLLSFYRKELGYEDAEAKKRAALAEKRRLRQEQEAAEEDSDDEGLDFVFV